MKRCILVFSSLLGLFCSVDVLHAQAPSAKVPATTWCYPVTPFREAGVSSTSSTTSAQAEVASEVHCRKRLVYEGPSRTRYFWSGVFWDTHFNKNQNPVFGTNYLDGKAWHLGFDFNGDSPGSIDMNEPVLAAANGYVEKVFHGDRSEAWGTVCVLKHYPTLGPSPVWTMYAHMATELCSNVGIEGFVKRGQQIGTIGDSDGWFNGGAHLHFEIWVDKPIEEFVDGELWKLRYLGWGYSHAAFNPDDPPGDRAGKDFYDRDHYTDPIDYIQKRLPGVAPEVPCDLKPWACQFVPTSFAIANTTPMVLNNEPAIEVEWTPSENVTTYRVTKYETATERPLAVSHFQSTTEFTDTDVENGQEVRYEMEAINSMGTTVADNIVIITPNVILDVPEPFWLQIAPSNCLNWLPHKGIYWGQSFGAESYTVTRNGVAIATGVEGREYYDSDIVEGVTYTYEVLGVNDTGSTPSDTTVSAHIPMGTCDAPDAPSVTTLAATDVTVTHARLHTTVNPNGAGTSYFFDWGLTTAYGNTTNSLSVGAGTADVTTGFSINPSCGNTYHFRAVAQSSGGTAYGADLTFTTPLCFVPAPSNLTAVLTPDHTVDLTWSDNSLNEEAFFIYRTRQSTGGSSVNTFPPANTTSWIDDISALPDDTYCYTVAGWNQPTNVGPHSNEVCVTKPHGAAPPSSTNTQSLSLVRSNSQYTLITDTAQTGLDVTGDLTVQMWVNFTTLPASAGNYVFASKWNESSGANERSFKFAYYYTGGQYRFRFHTSDNGVNNTGKYDVFHTLPTGVWTHIVAVYTAANGAVEFFVNGVSVGQSTGLHTQLYNGTANFTIGYNADLGPSYVDGLIDEVQVYARALTEVDIAAAYQQECAGSEGGLVACWHFNSDATDASGGTNDLTLVGSPVFANDTPFVGGAPSTIALTDVAGWWDVSEGSGSTVSDSMVSGTNGTITGATWTSGGPSSLPDGLDFNGVEGGDYVEVVKDYDLAAGTVCVWARVDDFDPESDLESFVVDFGNAGGEMTLMTVQRDGTDDFRGRTRWGGTGGTDTDVDANSRSTNVLYHVCYGWDTATSTNELWVDGISHGTSTASGVIADWDYEFYWGRRASSNSKNLDGQLYQVTLFSRKLADAEIGDVYNGGEGVTYDILFP